MKSTLARDLRRTEIERSEANVVKVAESIFGYNPFEMEQKDKLYCISSGASATSEIERDVILVEARGADAKVDFISERLEKHKKFFDPLDLSVLFRKPSEVAILYGTGVRRYAGSSFKSILRSSHCERTRS
jgi:hypothetical protein